MKYSTYATFLYNETIFPTKKHICTIIFNSCIVIHSKDVI